MNRLPFYPSVEFRSKQVMFEMEDNTYRNRINLHLIYGKEHVPDFYLIQFNEQGILIEMGVGQYLGDVSLDLDFENARRLKIIGVDLV